MDKKECPCSYGICDECEANGKFEPRSEADADEEPERWKKNFLEKFLKTY